MNLSKTFKIYLKTQGVSPLTVKNYLSDLRHFLGWMELFLRTKNLPFSPDEPKYLSQSFNQNLVEKYQSYLTTNSLPPTTINRRLSTLRTFAKFCLSQAWISENPTKHISNITIKQNSNQEEKKVEEKMLAEFREALLKERNSPNTIKNYLSDIREFLGFLEIAT